LLRGPVRADARGWFHKTFHVEAFADAGLRTDWREEYCSLSRRSVLRGMHFQVPPADHAKLVYCLAGEVLDVVVDLRAGSPTFGEHRAFTLTPEAGAGLYIPEGLAHGFLGLSAESLMYYKVTSVHAPDADRGIAWDSFGFDWPVDAPLLSDRDRGHPPLAEFHSPFRFGPAESR
ncbi:MAG TPA: dTDP-4-dehydrorhamnose 3,5-epimerase family protein, partial [Allosphingosinicella sp.]